MTESSSDLASDARASSPGKNPIPLSSAFDEYLLLLQFGPAVLASVPALAIDLNDPDMKILWCSQLFNEMFGYDPRELCGQTVNILLRPESRANHLRYFSQYQRAPNIRTMNDGVWVDGLRKDGALIKVQVSLYPHLMGRLDCVIGCVCNVTAAYERVAPILRPLMGGH